MNEFGDVSLQELEGVEGGLETGFKPAPDPIQVLLAALRQIFRGL
jgi:hypothetical protein